MSHDIGLHVKFDNLVCCKKNIVNYFNKNEQPYTNMEKTLWLALTAIHKNPRPIQQVKLAKMPCVRNYRKLYISITHLYRIHANFINSIIKGKSPSQNFR